MFVDIKNKVAQKLDFIILKKQKKRVEKILISKDDGHFRKIKMGNQEFNKLQVRYKTRDEYKYDKFSNWLRGFNRANELINLNEVFKERNLNILELCCGDGMTGKILNDYGHNIIQHDIDDWRDSRARFIKFVKKDLTDSFHIPAEEFDLVFSFNSFEHIPKPAQTLSDIICHLKKGGYIFLEFGPLFNSPWGLHAYRTIYIPYVQFLFSEDFIYDKLSYFGVMDLGKELNQLQPLNKWSYEEFENLWNSSSLEIVYKEKGTDFSHLNIIEEFPEAFQNRNLNINEISTQWIRVILKR